MGHGTSTKARLNYPPSERIQEIPRNLLSTVEKMVRDSYLEGFDLALSYEGDSPVVNGRTDSRTLRKSAWEDSDAREEFEILKRRYKK